MLAMLSGPVCSCQSRTIPKVISGVRNRYPTVQRK